MSVFQDPKTNHWGFRVVALRPSGEKERLRGSARQWGQKDSAGGAREAERLAIERFRATGETKPPSKGASAAGAGDVSPLDAPATVPAAAIAGTPTVPTVEEYSEEWLRKSAADDKPATYRHKKQSLQHHIIPRFGKLRLDEVRGPLVESWRLHLRDERKLAPATVSRLLAQLRSLLGYAHRNEVITRLPPWPTQKVPLPEPEFLSFEDADKLLAAAWRDLVPFGAMAIVALRTGLRHGELTALEWGDIDLPRKRLWVRLSRVDGVVGTTKSGVGREVPLPDDAIKALATIFRKRRSALVFSTEDGGPLEYWVTTNALKLLCRAAGLLPFGWHLLRHSYASHLAMRGISLKAIQELLGHSSIKITERYSHLQKGILYDAVARLTEPPPSGGRSDGLRRSHGRSEKSRHARSEKSRHARIPGRKMAETAKASA